MRWIRTPRRRMAAAAVGALVLGAATACGSTVTSSAHPVAGSTQTVAPESTTTAKPSPTAHPHGKKRGAPMHSRVTTKKKVIYVTVDDGFSRDPGLPGFLRAHHHLPITAFLVGTAVRGHVGYFKKLAAAGADIQNHTLSHPDLTRLSPAKQRRQICGNADLQRRDFGGRQTLLRPPYGAWNASTARAARACGVRDIVMWGIEVRGHRMHYAGPPRLQTGDVLLLHFRPGLVNDLKLVLKTAHRQGFTIARLPHHFH